MRAGAVWCIPGRWAGSFRWPFRFDGSFVADVPGDECAEYGGAVWFGYVTEPCPEFWVDADVLQPGAVRHQSPYL